ncbi:MAG: hypothetical protein QOI74_2042, partial [Micromonosporaceae bacterium]|nr:hypothetical protein [Micromonosporaceae bacterium]
VADRIGRELNAPFRLADREIVVHASIGIAASIPGLTSAEELLRNADVAMYEAKKHDRPYQVFTPGMDDTARLRLELGADLRRAVDDGELRLQYQPIVGLAGADLLGVEALGGVPGAV